MAIGTRGRKRKPTAVNRAAGTYDKDPQQEEQRAGEYVPNPPLGPPPKWLSKQEREVWVDMLSRTAPGLLKAGDEDLFEFAVLLVAEFRNPATRKSFMNDSKKTNAFIKALNEFGMSPAGRTYIKARDLNLPPQKPQGFAALRAGKRRG